MTRQKRLTSIAATILLTTQTFAASSTAVFAQSFSGFDGSETGSSNEQTIQPTAPPIQPRRLFVDDAPSIDYQTQEIYRTQGAAPPAIHQTQATQPVGYQSQNYATPTNYPVQAGITGHPAAQGDVAGYRYPATSAPLTDGQPALEWRSAAPVPLASSQVPVDESSQAGAPIPQQQSYSPASAAGTTGTASDSIPAGSTNSAPLGAPIPVQRQMTPQHQPAGNTTSITPYTAPLDDPEPQGQEPLRAPSNNLEQSSNPTEVGSSQPVVVQPYQSADGEPQETPQPSASNAAPPGFAPPSVPVTTRPSFDAAVPTSTSQPQSDNNQHVVPPVAAQSEINEQAGTRTALSTPVAPAEFSTDGVDTEAGSAPPPPEDPGTNEPTDSDPRKPPSISNAGTDAVEQKPQSEEDLKNLPPISSFQYTKPDDIPEPPKEAVRAWEKVQKDGDEAFIKCEFGNAERLFKKALAQARALPPTDTKFSKSAGELGRLLVVRGRFNEAEPLLEEELCMKELAMDGEAGEIIPTLGDLIKFYLEYGTKKKAVPYTHELLAFVEGKLFEYSTAARGAVSLKSGQPLQGWAGSAAPQMQQPVIEWAITCDAIGELFHQEGELELADRLFKAALDIKTTVLGKNHLSLANSYDSLGSVCLTRGDMEQAEEYFSDSLKMTEKILGTSDWRVYPRIDKLAKCYIKEKKFDKAEALYLRAKNYWSNVSGDPGTKLRAVFALACLYCDHRNFSAAAPLLSQAKDMAEDYYGRQSYSLVPYLRKLAYCQYYLGNKGANEQLNARANHIAPVVKPIQATTKMEAGDWGKKVN